jgi:thymidylate synthase (FAD)
VEKKNPIRFRSDMTVELKQSMASDSAVLMAARVSTGSESTTPEKDAGLLNYLMRDRHGSPFEHNAFTFYIEAPIFVFREFMRHRIASYNEESGRYKELKPVFYVPDLERNLVQEGKPGHYIFTEGSHHQYATVMAGVQGTCAQAWADYQAMLNAEVAREVARIVLPLNTYSSMYVTMNARSLMNFLSLRTKREGTHFPSFPQREIEMVAEKMEEIFAKEMPETYAAFNKNGRVAP